MNKEDKNTILIVDDDPMYISFLINVLKNDYILLVAKDGFSAIALTVEHLPDLILMDVDMPGMDGHELFLSLQTLDATKTIPVIFLTARETQADEKMGLELGAVDYILKSKSPDIIRMRIRNQIRVLKKK